MEKGSLDLAEETPAHQLYSFNDLEIDKGECYFLQPRKFVLGQSFEYVKLPDFITGELSGRSSLAKSGIEVHATAGRVAHGFGGHLTFELKNPGEIPVKLRPLQRIASLMFYLTQKVETPYKGMFQHQVRIKSPKPDNDLRKLVSYFRRQ